MVTVAVVVVVPDVAPIVPVAAPAVVVAVPVPVVPVVLPRVVVVRLLSLAMLHMLLHQRGILRRLLIIYFFLLQKEPLTSVGGFGSTEGVLFL